MGNRPALEKYTCTRGHIPFVSQQTSSRFFVENPQHQMASRKGKVVGNPFWTQTVVLCFIHAAKHMSKAIITLLRCERNFCKEDNYCVCHWLMQMLRQRIPMMNYNKSACECLDDFWYCTSRARFEVCWRAEDRNTLFVHTSNPRTLRTPMVNLMYLLFTEISHIWTHEMHHVGCRTVSRIRNGLIAGGLGSSTWTTSYLLLSGEPHPERRHSGRQFHRRTDRAPDGTMPCTSLDIDTAQSVGMKCYQTRIWHLIHFGNIPTEYLLRVDFLSGQLFHIRPPRAPCSTIEWRTTSGSQRRAPPLQPLQYFSSPRKHIRLSPKATTFAEDLERSLKD